MSRSFSLTVMAMLAGSALYLTVGFGPPTLFY